MEFLAEYGMFLAKAVTILVALVLAIAAIANASGSGKAASEKELKVTCLNEELESKSKHLKQSFMSKAELKQAKKDEKKEAKAKKSDHEDEKGKLFVIDFDGDVKASAVDDFREEITLILSIADPKNDAVAVRLESPGGMVHSYGLASAQMDRIRNKGIPLTACVDKVAASGGYMMACVADRIVASPFAIMGSIGVVAQIPNFNRLLKKNDVDYEIHTAGEYKRTLTMFGENTDAGRAKFKDDLEDTHELFKNFVKVRRDKVDVEAVANGDIWFGERALDVHLVDELQTSDEYLVNACEQYKVYVLSHSKKKTLAEKLGIAASSGVENAVSKWLSHFQVSKFFS